ncbi:MAG: hypothetical protein H7066_16090 [Cytophagaceae bacterium]|nr:hypothetical protein [Gemmatimonadaceae bacterium]
MVSRHPLKEGLVAGALGACVIAAWTFAADALTDRIGMTPALVGSWLFSSFGASGFAVNVAGYLVSLFVGVITIGIVGSYVYNASEERPSRMRAFIALAIVLEAVFLMVIFLAARSELFGAAAWVYGLVGNALGAFAMGRYLWRRHHPEAAWDWKQANDSHFHAGQERPLS